MAETDNSALRDKLAEHLETELNSAYDCDRVWEAWFVGTMSHRDFSAVNDRLDEIVEGVAAVVEANEPQRIQHLLEANNRYLNRARVSEGCERAARDKRQDAMLSWARETFGNIEGCDPVSLEERARRFLEEALELVQACGLDDEMATRVKDRVYSREPGDVRKEIGQSSMTLSILAEVLGESVAQCEVDEFDRVQSKSKAHVEARHRAKMEEGI